MRLNLRPEGGARIILHALDASVIALPSGFQHQEPGTFDGDRIHAYIGGALHEMKGAAHAVGGTADHVHVFAGLRASHCLADVMREIKSECSAWIHKTLGQPAFAWQEGYGGFTVSASHIDAVRQYVLNQEEHHRVRSFQEEYVAMLKRGLVEYDERYLW